MPVTPRRPLACPGGDGPARELSNPDVTMALILGFVRLFARRGSHSEGTRSTMDRGAGPQRKRGCSPSVATGPSRAACDQQARRVSGTRRVHIAFLIQTAEQKVPRSLTQRRSAAVSARRQYHRRGSRR